jgi:hypothetical protein
MAMVDKPLKLSQGMKIILEVGIKA